MLSAAEVLELESLLNERDRRKRARAGLGYVPHGMHPKQLDFMALGCSEALYGGAAGGGKTDALLAAALRWVHVPGYSALLLRRTYPALALPNAIMDRARQWLRPTDAAWDGDRKCWRFPSGAVLQFGYCDSTADLDRYQSAEFQFVGIDELTEWPEPWYRFLFSRIRRPVTLDVPLRMRAATNPGGLGQEWVREAFGIPENRIVTEPIGLGSQTVFLPARAEDNPSLDLATYEESLRQMCKGAPQKYEQLRWGKWIRDGEGLVYSAFTSANVIEALPALGIGESWNTYLALDFGIIDRNAVAVMKWRPNDPITYVARCYKFKGGPSALAENVRPIYDDERCTHIIGDVGGMGKAYEEEWARRFRLPMRAAKKHDKLGNISLLNAALTDRTLMVVGSACGDLTDEYKRLPWAVSREGRREADGFDNHCADAVLYGWRDSPSFSQTPEDVRLRTAAEIIRAETDAAWEREGRMLRIAKERDEDMLGLGTHFDPFAREAGWDNV